MTRSLDRAFLKKLTVLYVEDSDSALVIGARLISRLCATVLTAQNGAEGVEKFRAHGPDIIVTDIQMPIMDGLAMAEAIRQENRAVPIIISTAFEQVHLLRRAIEVGVDSYLLKPVTRSQLTAKLLDCAHLLRIEWERRSGEQYLLAMVRETVGKLSRVVEDCPSALVITDCDSIIEFANRSFCRLTGYNVEELVGKSLSLLNSRSHSPEVCHAIGTTIAAEGVWRGELLSSRKDGTEYWEYAVISPLRDGEGTITGYMNGREDVTEKKQLAGMLSPAFTLDQAGRLAGGLVHKLDNILSVINGYGALLKIADELGDEQQEHVRKILAASAQASTLTHTMLSHCIGTKRTTHDAPRG